MINILVYKKKDIIKGITRFAKWKESQVDLNLNRLNWYWIIALGIISNKFDEMCTQLVEWLVLVNDTYRRATVT